MCFGWSVKCISVISQTDGKYLTAGKMKIRKYRTLLGGNEIPLTNHCLTIQTQFVTVQTI